VFRFLGLIILRWRRLGAVLPTSSKRASTARAHDAGRTS
jgi:hypothetical protein